MKKTPKGDPGHIVIDRIIVSFYYSKEEIMIKSMYSILFVVLCTVQLFAGVKERTFSGTIIRFDDESNHIVVQNENKKMSFFLLVDCIDNANRSWDKCTDCYVTITYKKAHNLLMANKIEL